MFSNHMNPLIVPPEDRRIWPVVCEHPPKSQAYYQTLYDLLKNPAVVRALYWFLKEHIDKAGFNPNARAPVNSWHKVVFGGDADQLNTDVSRLLVKLRKLGARAIYRSQLIEILRKCDVELPLVGDSGAQWVHFNRTLNDLNVLRGDRVRTKSPMPGSDNRSIMLTIALDPRELFNSPRAFRAECERVWSDPAFKNLELE
jgi:hypothetical protein